LMPSSERGSSFFIRPPKNGFWVLGFRKIPETGPCPLHISWFWG
jgi:hypothetical protein